MFFRRFAITLETNLYTTLHKLIGLKLDVLDGLLIFRIKVILVLFISAIDILEFNTFRTKRIISFPTTSQYFWKKIADILSGPGAFVGCICFRVASTPSLVNVEINLWFISSVTLVGIVSVTSKIRLGWEVVNNVSKQEIAVAVILSFVSHQFPYSSHILLIVFFFLLYEALEWKNFVLRSP